MFFEAHITVEPHDIKRWVRTCETLGIKPLFIELTEGTYKKQLMCAVDWRSGAEEAITRTETLQKDIEQRGFVVVRNKLECALKDAPAFDDYAYLECHVKLRLTPQQEQLLPDVAAASGAHISFGLLNNPNGLRKWYLTNRRYAGTIDEARESFRETLSITKDFFPVHGMEMECAVFDSNPAIDRGWAEPT